MSRSVKALVVDDHPLIADATKALLDSVEGLEVIGVAHNGAQCMEQVSLHRPGLVFLDYHLPGRSGLEIAAQIKMSYPDIHIVIFTGVELKGIYSKSMELGVSGVLSKESSQRTIKNMVNCILDGYTMVPLSFYRNMQLSGAAQENCALNEEELLMMNMMVKGATHEQIAARIHMSKRTVDNYLRRIYEKLGAKSKAEALEKFIKSVHNS
jgi:two-component system competent response regulator ComA